MFGSDILDVVIGMVFVFLMLSLVCSAANEFLESLLKKRAQDLERGIGEMLGDPGNTTGFITRIYNHGLVNSLFKGRHEDSNKGNLPSYIPARNFALAVIDLVKNPPADITLPPNLATALRTFRESAGADEAKLQASVEDWFNSSMDRVSGWYKRRSQALIFVIGLIVVIAVNVDTVSVAQSLANDASLRKGLIASAEATARNPAPGGGGQSADDSIRQTLNSLGNLGLPIGWNGKPKLSATMKEFQGIGDPVREWALAVYVHWFGWLLTAVAISLGAPFWFDLLNKFITIRSSLKPQDSPKVPSTTTAK